MATVIKIKNSSVTAEPADNALAKGELAYSYNSNKLFIGQISAGDVVATAIGGKAYTDLIATDTKTFTAAAITNDNTITIQTTANNGNIVLTPHGTGLVKTDNLGFGSNTISSENTDGDIILAPNGNGKVKTDNLSFDGSTIASFSGTVTDNINITLTPQADGVVDVSTSKITNVTNPTADQDAATKKYVDDEINGVSSDITISDNQSTPVTDTLTTGSTFTIAGTANEIETAVTDEGGSPTGNATVTIGLPDDVTVGGTLAVNGDSITTDDASFNLINTTATTLNIGGAGTTIGIGAATGTTTINHATTSTAAGNGALVVTGGVGIGENLNVTGNGVITGDLAVNGGDLTTTAATFGLLDTTATTINFGGAGTTIAIGAATGTTTINHATTSTTSSTGALVVSGGVGIVENLNVGGNAVITGNLTVDGTTTTVNSTTTTLQDPIITLGGGEDNAAPTADDNKDRGVEFQWHNGTDAKVGFFGYDDSESKFTFIQDATNSSEVFSGTAGNVAFGDIDGANVALTGSIGNYDGAAPTNGQLLIGNTANGDLQLGTIAVTANTGLATPTLGAGTITLAGSDSSTQATVDPVAELVQAGSFETGVEYTIVSTGDTNFQALSAADDNPGTTFTANGAGSGSGTAISSGDNFAVSGTNTSKGVASFASEQFTVTSGHVVVTTIDGGEF
jgi:hypothetical protein